MDTPRTATGRPAAAIVAAALLVVALAPAPARAIDSDLRALPPGEPWRDLSLPPFPIEGLAGENRYGAVAYGRLGDAQLLAVRTDLGRWELLPEVPFPIAAVVGRNDGDGLVALAAGGRKLYRLPDPGEGEWEALPDPGFRVAAIAGGAKLLYLLGADRSTVALFDHAVGRYSPIPAPPFKARLLAGAGLPLVAGGDGDQQIASFHGSKGWLLEKSAPFRLDALLGSEKYGVLGLATDGRVAFDDGGGWEELPLPGARRARLLAGDRRAGPLILFAPAPPAARADTEPPVVTVLSPRPGSRVRASPVVVLVEAVDRDPLVEVRIGGRRAQPAGGNRYRLEVDLPPGPVSLRIEAADKAGNRAEAALAFTVDREAPVVRELEAEVVIRGLAEPGAKVWVEGVPATVDKDGRFEARIPRPRGDTVEVRTADAAGNEAVVTIPL